VPDVADTEANVERFGRPASSRGDGRGGAFPQVRVVGLAECGSHAIIDAAVGAYRQGEQTLVESVLRSLLPGMLLLADRGFFSYTLWDKARATGADLLWRIKSNAVLPVEKRYSDGSFASRIYPGPRPGATTPTVSTSESSNTRWHPAIPTPTSAPTG